jgi:hypothetical protein
MKTPMPRAATLALFIVLAAHVEPVVAEQRPSTLLAQRLEEDRPTVTTPAEKTAREHWQLKVTPGYEQGDYDADGTTRIFGLPFTLRYLGENWDLSATLGYVRVDSPGNVTLVGGQATRTDTGNVARRVDEGFGDIVLKGRYYLLQDTGAIDSLPSITPLLRLKIPTARSPHLGTGEPDFGFGLEFDKTFGRAFIVFGDVTYTIIGEPAKERFDNRWGASVGAGYRITDVVTVSGLLDWRQAITQKQHDPVDLIGFVSFKLTPTFTASPYLSVGLTSGSADVGVGVELSYKFGRY